ncbi:hypothetical protein HJC23_004788 [Cyclotella cryptica]|uniref:Uncharacterized protein n=1 Tax=Cyclotella cryptica TaxID=29204 RepID=A0ABD3PXE8_9STRA|eukprot:CCRYP_010413-RA/>CCRYP_010413-RA protein AED:0.15 eAED:0.16 QI:0/0/0/1/1/1/2/0/453
MNVASHSTPPTLEPYWKCLFHEAFRQDTTPSVLKHAYLLISIVAHLPVLFPESFGRWIFRFPDSYFSFDETFLPHGNFDNTFVRFLKLISLTIGLSYTSMFVCLSITVAAYTTLIWNDATTSLHPFPWPKSWETNNDACYNDMFCEPSRKDCLVRRPGNALSNFLYFLLALMILMSTVSCGLARNVDSELPHIYGLLVSDFIFGVMLLILAVSSTVWHSCNAMWSHAVDLWSMEAVIIYLTFRMIALGVYVILFKWTESHNFASFFSSALCFAMFIGHIYDNACRWYNKHLSRFWENMCPFAVRNRLPNSPYILSIANDREKTQLLKPIGLLEIYLYALLPVSSNVLNWILIKTTFHTVGSSLLVRTLNRSLVFGWTYRLFERWGLDGCRHVLYCERKIDEAKEIGDNRLLAFWTVAAAVLSPTASLHFWTGVTVIAAFCHSRSTEVFMLSNF